MSVPQPQYTNPGRRFGIEARAAFVGFGTFPAHLILGRNTQPYANCFGFLDHGLHRPSSL
jgi:hypothetical protein